MFFLWTSDVLRDQCFIGRDYTMPDFHYQAPLLRDSSPADRHSTVKIAGYTKSHRI